MLASARHVAPHRQSASAARPRPLPFVLLRLPAVRAAMLSLVAFMRGSGGIGVLVFLGVEAFVMTLTAPIWIMSALAGYAYGFPRGVLVACPGVALGACAAFLLGRVFVGKYLRAQPGQGQFWRAVEQAVTNEGLKITLLMRLTVVVPQNLSSYMLSATPLSLRDFALGTFVGLMPVTAFQVYLGSSVESAIELVSGNGAVRGPLAWIAPALGGVFTLVAIAWSSRIARRALDKALAETQKPQEA